MEYVYAAMLLDESEQEINEENVTAVLEAAGVSVEESRAKALVAALEDVDIAEAVESGAAMPAGGGGSTTSEAQDDEADAAADEADDDDDEGDEAADESGDEEEEASGEGLGELFG